VTYPAPFRRRRVPTGAVALLLAILLSLAGCSDDDDGPTGPGQPEFDWSGAIETGDRLEIRGVNGSIVASTVSGRTATVSGQFRDNGGDASTVDVQVVTHSGGVTICAIYPDVPGEPPNSCEPDGGEQNADSPVTIDFLIQMPADVEFTAVTVNGSLTADGLQRGANLVTVNGNVSAATTSLLTVATVNGSVDATLDAVTLSDPWALATVNGGVTARLPESVDATVSGTVANGAVFSDFPITETAPGVWSGTIGSGGPAIVMSVVNGSLSLIRIP
jgi:DUF4097 and DUF4098 domain-containing protein YvlB